MTRSGGTDDWEHDMTQPRVHKEYWGRTVPVLFSPQRHTCFFSEMVQKQNQHSCFKGEDDELGNVDGLELFLQISDKPNMNSGSWGMFTDLYASNTNLPPDLKFFQCGHPKWKQPGGNSRRWQADLCCSAGISGVCLPWALQISMKRNKKFPAWKGNWDHLYIYIHDPPYHFHY